MGAIAPVLSIAATLVGAGISAIGAEQQAKANAAAANYNAQVAKNASIFAQQQGVVEAEKQQREAAMVIGKDRAAAAASGIDVNSGSPLDIQADNYVTGKLNEATALNNASRNAWGYATQSNLYGMEAQSDLTAGNYNAAGALIGGASELSNRWSQFQQSGAFDQPTLNMF
jgi:hypothetical protein